MRQCPARNPRIESAGFGAARCGNHRYTLSVTRVRRRWRRIAFTLLFVGLLIGVVLWFRSTSRPEWWAPPNPTDPHVLEVAEKVEYQLVEQAQLIRPSEEIWGVRVQESQVNAWLAGRLPKWLAHHDLRDVTDSIRIVQVRFEDGAVIVGAEIHQGLQPHVVSIRLLPELKDGRIALTADSVAIGKLSIGTAPIDRAVEELRSVISSDVLNDPAVVQVIETLRGERTWPAEFKLADGRMVEVLDLTIERGSVRATCRTLPKKHRAAVQPTDAPPEP